jgi:hypothetical protein
MEENERQRDKRIRVHSTSAIVPSADVRYADVDARSHVRVRVPVCMLLPYIHAMIT